MAFNFTEHESGTKSTTATTEHVLQTTSPNTTAGEFQFFLDLNALTAGTTLKIRVKEKIISGGTIRTVIRDFVTGVLAADDYGWASPKLLLINGWDFTIECSASSISIPWSIRKLADGAVLVAADLTAVKLQMTNALNVDTYAEPGQGTPAATTTLVAKIGYIFKNWRNRQTQTATAWALYNDDAVTVDQKSTVADDGTTASKTEIATGP